MADTVIFLYGAVKFQTPPSMCILFVAVMDNPRRPFSSICEAAAKILRIDHAILVSFRERTVLCYPFLPMHQGRRSVL